MLLVRPQFYSKLNEQLNKKAWLQSGPKVSQGRAPSKPGVSLLYFDINYVFSFILLMMPGWIPLVSYNFLFFSAKRCRNSWYREEDGGTIQEERWWYQYGKNYLLLSLMVLRIMRHIRLRIVIFLRCRHGAVCHATLHVMLQKLDPTVYVTICVTLLVHGEICCWWHHMQRCTGGHMVWSLIAYKIALCIQTLGMTYNKLHIYWLLLYYCVLQAFKDLDALMEKVPLLIFLYVYIKMIKLFLHSDTDFTSSRFHIIFWSFVFIHYFFEIGQRDGDFSWQSCFCTWRKEGFTHRWWGN